MRQDFQKEAHCHPYFSFKSLLPRGILRHNILLSRMTTETRTCLQAFFRDNLNLFGAEKVLVNKLLVSEKMLGGKFLVSEVILDNKILCPSMSSDKISDKQKQNSNSYSRIVDALMY